MKTFLKIISTILLIVVLAAVVTPAGYLAWRAGQPMELPQFKGLTYYQYLHWRKIALHQMALDYQAAHPNDKMGGGLDMCYRGDTVFTLLTLPLVAFYTLAGVFPGLEKYVKPSERQYIPQRTTLMTFLPNWWLTYERANWYMISAVVHDPVPYCRLQQNVPTPEQLQAMDDRLNASGH